MTSFPTLPTSRRPDMSTTIMAARLINPSLHHTTMNPPLPLPSLPLPGPIPRRTTLLPSLTKFRSLKRHKATGSPASGGAIDATRHSVYAAIDTTISGKPLQISYGSCYRDVERLCRFKHHEQLKLADYVVARSTSVFDDSWRPRLVHALESDDVTTFMTVVDAWAAILVTLLKLLLYMDRTYLQQHLAKPTVRKQFMLLIVDVVTPAIATINRWHLDMLPTKLAPAMAMSRFVLEVLEIVPQARLRPSILEKLLVLYTEQAKQWLDTEPDYLSTALTEISHELAYWTQCGYPQDFIKQLRQRLKWAVLFSQFDAVAAVVIPQLITSKTTVLVTALIKMCRQTQADYGYDAMTALQHQLQRFLQNQFDQVITTHSRTKALVPELVAAHTHWRVQFAPFCLEPDLEYAFRHSFTLAINALAAVVKEVTLQLCKYCDYWFKHRHIPFPEFRDAVLVVFNALGAKTAFVAAYRQALARRLLLLEGAVDVEETQLVDHMATIIGDDNNILSIHRMLSDLDTLRARYASVYRDSGIKLNVLVLKQEDWRDIPRHNLNLRVPAPLAEIMTRFATDYAADSSRQASQRLDWTNWWTHKLTIDVHFNTKTRSVQGNMFHAALVYLLCSGDPAPAYTQAQIINELGIDAIIAERLLVPLVDKGLVVVDNSGRYQWNFAFDDGSDKKIKLIVGKDKVTPAPTTSSAASEEAAVSHLVEQRIALECKCVLMRVMKTERQLSHVDLMNKCLDYFDTKPKPRLVRELKLQLDELVASDDLKRHDNGDIEYVP